MSGAAAHVAVLSVATTSGGTYSNLSGANSGDYSRDTDMLDTTSFEDGADRTFVPGLRGAQFDAGGKYVYNDTALGHLLSAHDNQTSVFVKWLPNGTQGWRFEAYVESIGISGEVDGLVELSCTLRQTGAVTTIS